VIFHSSDLIFIARHGTDHSSPVLPHRINHQANLAALKKMGAEEVIGINSTGGLKPHMKPGVIVIPDDYIQLGPGITTVTEKPLHIVPRIDQNVRKRLLTAARAAAIAVVDGGIYWQSPGPRLETRAEIAMISQFADIIGMTLASEAIVAQELGLPYASLCSVDNYAHGFEKRDLTLEKIQRHARLNTEAIQRIISCSLEQ
jgi:5'-methylthioadenosine phosphorylase